MRFLHAEQSWLRSVGPDVDCHMVGLAARLLRSIPRQGRTDELSVIYTEEPPLLRLVSVGSPQVVTPRVTWETFIYRKHLLLNESINIYINIAETFSINGSLPELHC